MKFLAIDLQYDFTRKGGPAYKNRPSIAFIQKTIIPFLRKKKIKIAEIISDYRQPRPGDRGDLCHPGEWGYTSEITKELVSRQWVKCMNSPIWTRKGIGNPKAKPGLPYPDSKRFGKWLTTAIGTPNKKNKIVLFGLTIDCCVLSTAQELNWRGYNVYILKEATDAYSGNPKEKERLLKSPVSNWADTVSWKDIIKSYT